MRARRAHIGALAALALIFAGSPTAALAADAPASSTPTISGRVVLPAGGPDGDFVVRIEHRNPFRLDWYGVGHRTVNPDGTFELPVDLLDRTPRLVLISESDGYVGGAYAGAGLPLVADPADGIEITGSLSGVVLQPFKSVSLAGTYSVSADFDWSVERLEFDVDEAGDEVQYAPNDYESHRQYTGHFSIENLFPDGRYLLKVWRGGGGSSVSGYYHAGVPGLVAKLEHATPLKPGAAPHLTIGSTLVEPKLSVVDAPQVSGNAVVGSTLTASAGSWSLASPTVTYHWLRDGSLIAGARSSSYSLIAADAGRNISVRVTAAQAGFAPVSVTIPARSVRPAALRATEAPAVTGTARLGATVRASAGAWSAAGVSVTHQWLRDGNPIKGATASTYTLKRADVGKRISVRATGSLAGHDDGVAVSKKKKVAKGKPKVTAKVKNVKAGKRARVVVRVKAAGLAKPRGTVIVKYGKKTVKSKLAAKRKGKVTVRLPKLKKGTYRVRVTYQPKAKSKKFVTKATAKKTTLRVR